MRVISKKALIDFWQLHANALPPLTSWYAVLSKTAFASFSDIRLAFNSADYVDPYTVFDIGGNNFRLVTVIHYNKQIVYVRHVFTHAEYDRWSKQNRNRKQK